MKKIVSIIISILLIAALTSIAFAKDQLEVEQKEVVVEEKANEDLKEEVAFLSSEESEEKDVVQRAKGVTEEMANANYWKNHALGSADDVIMTPGEIETKNNLFLASEETNMYDLEAIEEDRKFNAKNVRESLAGEIEKEFKYDNWSYLNGKQITEKEFNNYKEALKKAIEKTGYIGEQHYRYAVGVKRTNMGCAPTTDFLGISEGDYDNEIYSASLDVNEPFVIMQKCIFKGNMFYWGYSNNCSGWILADDLAICKNKAEWLDSWKVELDGKDFIVVTQDEIVLEPSKELAYSSEVKLTMGTVLKLVPEDTEKEIGERGTWNNYVVYLPTRNSEGKYEKKMALIAEHNSVSVGYLPMTQGNILDVAFSCLGNRYGWANQFDSLDCSGFTRTIYKCFGLVLPRNTNWQTAVESTVVNVEGLDEVKKEKLIETLPIGSLLFMKGHITMYIGSEDEINYVINDVGSLADTDTEKVLSQLSVIINPLTVRRGASYEYATWLKSIKKIVIMPNFINLADCDVEVLHDRVLESFVVTLSYKGQVLTENVNYSVGIETNPDTKITTMTMTGINNCIGTTQAILDPASPCSKHTVVEDKGIAATCTTPGLTEGKHCSVCGEVIVKQEIIPAFGHDWEDRYTVDKMCTGTEDGIMSIHCKNCDAVKNQMPFSKSTKPINPDTDDPSDPVGTGDSEGQQIAFWLLIMICAAGIIFITASTGIVMTNGKKIYLKVIDKFRRK